MHTLLIALFSALAWCSRTNTDKGPPQAPSFNPGGIGKIDRLVFEKHELDVGIEYNKYIPHASKDMVRVATWNTHMLLDLTEKKPAVTRVLEDLKEIGADVLLLEEIPLEGDRLVDFETGLDSWGYSHRALRFSDEEGAGLGIMVASKIPIESVEFLELGFKRILLDVGLGGGMHVLGTHLEVTSGSVRHAQSERIVAHLSERGYYSGSFVLAGDFNSQYLSDELTPFRESKEVAESFRGLNWTHPEYTCWSGAEIDFIFVGKQVSVSGVYVYHSATSDHLPLLIDIITKSSSASESPRNSEASDSVKLLAFVIFLALLIYAIALKYLPRSAWNNAYRVLRDFETM